jgi:hypothetical protein
LTVIQTFKSLHYIKSYLDTFCVFSIFKFSSRFLSFSFHFYFNYLLEFCTSLSVCPFSIFLSVCPFSIFLSICLSLSPHSVFSVFLSLCFFIYLSFTVSVSLSFCLSTCFLSHSCPRMIPFKISRKNFVICHSKSQKDEAPTKINLIKNEFRFEGKQKPVWKYFEIMSKKCLCFH